MSKIRDALTVRLTSIGPSRWAGGCQSAIIEKISTLVGHNGTRVTELVYRQQLRPVIQDGADAMDSIFPGESA